MKKQVLCALLAVALLAGVIPIYTMAEETERFIGIPPQITSAGIAVQDNAEIAASAAYATEAYNAAPADVDTVEEKVDWIAAQCRAEGLTEEWDIALWLHDWLIYNANYDYTFSNYDPSGVLLKGTGVCQSYAEAYCLLLDEFSIESQLVSAYEMNHAWNLVKLDGQWCHIDCTWDDPGEGGSEGYYYFGLDDSLMSRDHIWNTAKYPACTSRNNYYYIRTGANVAENEEEAEELFHRLLSARLESFECHYIGLDADYSIMEAFDQWMRTHGFEYGVRNASWMGTAFWVHIEVDYGGASHTHEHTPSTTEPTCAEQGFTIYKCICGDTYTDDYVPATGKHSYTDETDTTCNVCGHERTVKVDKIPVYRLYNPYTQEHLLTGGAAEKDALLSVGWSLDGVAWKAPVEGIPVYRLYNPYDDWHTYTTSETERDTMVAAGWKVDGVVSRGYEGPDGRPIYRLFNPYVRTNFHLFTAGADERDLLVSAGWKLEGVAWYAVK